MKTPSIQNLSQLQHGELYTVEDLQRIAIDWKKIAKDEVNIQMINTSIYCYTSEIGALRLINEYRSQLQTARAGYSENLRTWFFVLDI